MKLLACLFAVSACVVPPAQEGAAPPGAAPEGAQVAAAAPSCFDILNCFKGCTDTACNEACIARGDATSQAQVTALLTCASETCKNDSDCMSATCSAQIEACREPAAPVVADTTATAPAGIPPAATPGGPQQPVANENVLTWLQSQPRWVSNRHQFNFYADGTVRRSQGGGHYTDKGRMTCVSSFNDIGTVVQQGDLLIMTFSPDSSNNCGIDNDGGRAQVVRYQILWIENHYDNNPDLQIKLRNLDCPGGDDMWCADALEPK